MYFVYFFIYSFFYHLSEQPRFGSGLIIELRRDPSQASEANVHVFYANQTASQYDIHRLRLNESAIFVEYCQTVYCPFEAFVAALQTLLPVDIEEECTLTNIMTLSKTR